MPATELLQEQLNPGGPALDLRDVEVRFGGLRALQGVSFTVAPQELVAVVGPNGAGKSTLLNAISGLLGGRARGSISLFGDAIAGRRPHLIAGRGLGRSFQDPPLVDSESVLDNVLAGAHATIGYGMSAQFLRGRAVRRLEEQARARALSLLELCGLSGSAETASGELPYGSRKLVDILRALVARPGLVLLDEPTSGLDHAEQQTVLGLLREISARERTTMLIVEHHMQLVRALADRVVGLQAGSVLLVGSPGEVLDSPTFRAAVVGGSSAAPREPAPRAPEGADA